MDNVALFFLIFGLSNHSATLDTLMLFGARYLIYLSFLLIFILSFKGGVREKKAVLLTVLSIPLALLFIKGIHLLFYEPRPFISFHFSPLVTPTGNASFPSVHTSLMAILTFSYIYSKSKWTPLFLLLLIWVGTARIYVGVHYPLDIIGGAAVGLISLIITLQIKKKFLRSKIFLPT